MSPWEPAVHRHQAGLGPEAEHGGQQHPDLEQRTGGHEARATADQVELGQGEERHPDADATQVGDCQVDKGRPADRPVGASDQDDRRRDQSHQLPAGQEGRQVARGEHQHKAADEDTGQARQGPAEPIRLQVAAGVDEHGYSDDGQGQ